MKSSLACIFLALVSAGCHVREVGVSRPATVVVVEEDSRAWDGVVWVTYRHHHHSAGCGHYYHHAEWHLYPAEHVYVGGHGHFGATIRVEGKGSGKPEHHKPDHDKPKKPHPPK
jgi:hypothetical protein